MSLLPRKAREKANPGRYAIKNFLLQAAREIPEGASVLDAGAGSCRYRPFFPKQRYIAADFCKAEGENYKRMDFITDLNLLALKEGSVDAVINIQVLEHVPEPATLVAELKRVLKPGGTLYLTCPQNWGVHMAPYDFYRYTCYGLEHIFRKAGMEVEFIKPIGGWFNLAAMISSRLPGVLGKPDKGIINKAIYKIRDVLVKEVFFYWIPFFLVHMDFLDRRKDFTIGYLCKVKKP